MYGVREGCEEARESVTIACRKIERVRCGHSLSEAKRVLPGVRCRGAPSIEFAKRENKTTDKN